MAAGASLVATATFPFLSLIDAQSIPNRIANLCSNPEASLGTPKLRLRKFPTE